MKRAYISVDPNFYGAPEEIRTPDPLVRSQVLYPAELRAHARHYTRYRMFLKAKTWRRARDSNPRYRFKPVCFLSREVPSTTRPALRFNQTTLYCKGAILLEMPLKIN